MADNNDTFSTASHMVFDTMPLVDIFNQNQQYTRKVNAEKAARSATGAAKIDESFNKLNTQVWEKDNEHMKNLLTDTENLMADTYDKYGPTAIYDNPELNKGFQSQIRSIKTFAEMSKAQQKVAEEQLKLRADNPDELDYESAAKFDEWMSLPSDQRVLEPVPMLKKRSTTLTEAVAKYAKPNLEGLLVQFESPGEINEETGEYKTYKGKKLDKKRLNALTQKYNTNPNSVIFRSADRETREDFDYETTSPTIINEQGVEVPNPQFEVEITNARSKRIEEELLQQADREFTEINIHNVASKSERDKDNVQVAEVSEDERTFTTESLPAVFKNSKVFSASATDESGKKYYKLKNPIWDVEGNTFTSIEDLKKKGYTVADATEIGIGSWVDAKGNVKPDDSGLTEKTDIKNIKAQREVSITKPEGVKTVSVKKYFKPDGTVVQTSEATAIEGEMISHTEIKAVEKNGKLYFEGDKEFKNGKPKTIEIAKIKTKTGEIVQIPADENVKNTFKKTYEEIGSTTGITYKGTGKTSGISW